MLELPVPVLDYIYSLTIENRSPAYLLVNKDGCLSSWGGKLSTYGITNLEQGKYVGEQILFLEGLLPLDVPIFLSCIETKRGLAADIYIFPKDDGDWILLLDATLEANQRSLVQQKGNDLSLLRKNQSRVLNQSLGNDSTENLAQSVLNIQATGERRDVTIMLVNICGFTVYSDNNPADVVFKTLNLYLPSMLQPILDEAGMVDKIFGDTVMACFGVLPSTSSPPTQAIKAALKMIEAVRNIGKVRQAGNNLKLEIGIGIASGSVALGLIGSRDSTTFSAIGYCVNLAMRLESQARPSEILIDENTFARLDNMQKYFSATMLLGKGTIEPIQTYSYLVQ